MKILIVASEMVPYAKTGGLADVVGALPKELAGQGAEVSVILPCYQGIESRFKLKSTGIKVKIPILDGRSAEDRECDVLLHEADKSVKVYLIKHDQYFNRQYLYTSPEGDYTDNPARFYLLCRAGLELIKQIPWKPDVIHCHDWQAALVPILMKTTLQNDPAYQGIKTVMTIHNLGYQGIFWRWDMKLFGIDWSYFTADCLEFYGNINLLKGGIIFSDLITTVSRGYADEIQRPEFGMGLDGVLGSRKADLFGVVNGIDYSIWSPEVDKKIAANYSIGDVTGKARCKAELQTIFNLPFRPRVPLIGCISRLVDQKGFDLIEMAIEELVKRSLQLVVLGTGEKKYEQMFEDVARLYPKRAAVRLAYDDTLAHQIEAGADIFLMPSLYEPCGLNQMISLKYGTIPLVRHTGGLADTVQEFDPETGKGNGFKFGEYSPPALIDTIDRALALYKKPKTWKTIMHNAMTCDHSWSASAKTYLELYQKAINK